MNFILTYMDKNDEPAAIRFTDDGMVGMGYVKGLLGKEVEMDHHTINVLIEDDQSSTERMVPGQLRLNSVREVTRLQNPQSYGWALIDLLMTDLAKTRDIFNKIISDAEFGTRMSSAPSGVTVH